MTNDDPGVRQQAVDAMVKGVARKTALMIAIAIAAVLIYAHVRSLQHPMWLLPASVLFGGTLGLLNFRWLAISVQRVYLRPGATSAGSKVAAGIISLLKLSLIFIVLFIVIKWRLLHVLALAGGLTLSFLAILWEGAAMMREHSSKQE